MAFGRSPWLRFPAALVLVALAPVVGAQTPDGRHVYERHCAICCAICHGVSGDGSGEAAVRLGTKPADLTAGRYKFRSCTLVVSSSCWKSSR
ncbi:MAG: hypothetical protein HYS14_09570 [Candidatus Rokubacteria bacterium]|nr:hypothetical protein [Candidatus Rokubacteria bacterium]